MPKTAKEEIEEFLKGLSNSDEVSKLKAASKKFAEYVADGKFDKIDEFLKIPEYSDIMEKCSAMLGDDNSPINPMLETIFEKLTDVSDKSQDYKEKVEKNVKIFAEKYKDKLKPMLEKLDLEKIAKSTMENLKKIGENPNIENLSKLVDNAKTLFQNVSSVDVGSIKQQVQKALDEVIKASKDHLNSNPDKLKEAIVGLISKTISAGNFDHLQELLQLDGFKGLFDKLDALGNGFEPQQILDIIFKAKAGIANNPDFHKNALEFFKKNAPMFKVLLGDKGHLVDTALNGLDLLMKIQGNNTGQNNTGMLGNALSLMGGFMGVGNLGQQIVQVGGSHLPIKPSLTKEEVETLNNLWAQYIIELAGATKSTAKANAFENLVFDIVKRTELDKSKKAAIESAYNDKVFKEYLSKANIEDFTSLEKNAENYKILGFMVAATTLLFAISEVQSRHQILSGSTVISSLFGATKKFVEALGSVIGLNKDLSGLVFVGILGIGSAGLFGAYYQGLKGVEAKEKILKDTKTEFDKVLVNKVSLP